jgi:hypothetical protein
MAGQGSTGNVIAALASFFIPGLGQFIQGRPLLALAMFVLAGFALRAALRSAATTLSPRRELIVGDTKPPVIMSPRYRAGSNSSIGLPSGSSI